MTPNTDEQYAKILSSVNKCNKSVSSNKFSGMPPAETERRRRTKFLGFFSSQVPRAKTLRPTLLFIDRTTLKADTV